MSHAFTSADLDAYLDEALTAVESARVEQALRDDAELAKKLAEILARRDAGVHSLGEIWRRRRLTCPTRAELGSYLLGVAEEGHAGYIAFHVEAIGCRVCQANLEDLRRERGEAPAAQERRRKYFESSAGRLGGR